MTLFITISTLQDFGLDLDLGPGLGPGTGPDPGLDPGLGLGLGLGLGRGIDLGRGFLVSPSTVLALDLVFVLGTSFASFQVIY